MLTIEEMAGAVEEVVSGLPTFGFKCQSAANFVCHMLSWCEVETASWKSATILAFSRSLMPTNQDIVSAYRNLYRVSLRAIQFAKPARFVLRHRLRTRFREGAIEDFDADKIARTLEFLEHARTSRGLEHKLLKNILFVWGKKRDAIHLSLPKHQTAIFAGRYDAFEETLKNMNNSIGLCL